MENPLKPDVPTPLRLGLSLRAKILGMFLFTALVMGAILGLVLHGNREMDLVTRKMVAEDLVAMQLVKEMQFSLATQDDAISRYLLSGDDLWLETQQAEHYRLTAALLQVRGMVTTRAESELVNEIEEGIYRHRDRLNQILEARADGRMNSDQANRLRRENSLLPDIYRKCESLLAIHQGLLEYNQQEAERIAGRYRNFEYLTLLLVLVSTAALGLLLRRNVLTPIQSLAKGARAFSQGHLDYRVPVHGSDELGHLSQTFNQMAAALQRERGRLTEMSITDELTRLKNFRHFAARLEEEVNRAERYGHHLALALFDIDHFKQYNDTHGHPAGNEVLRVIGRLLRDNARGTDILARYGGEEFAAILPETTKDAAVRLAEKICRLIEMHAFPGEETQPGGRLTLSSGVSAIPDDAGYSPLLLDGADRALYSAKRGGRNRVEAYAPEMGAPQRNQILRRT